MVLDNIFLISLAVITVLLVVFIVILLVTGKKNAGKQVAHMVKSGKSLNLILEVGKKKRWNEREVKLYYLLYTVQDYVSDGYNLDEIESMALDNGWPRDLVNIVVNKLR